MNVFLSLRLSRHIVSSFLHSDAIAARNSSGATLRPLDDCIFAVHLGAPDRKHAHMDLLKIGLVKLRHVETNSCNATGYAYGCVFIATETSEVRTDRSRT